MTKNTISRNLHLDYQYYRIIDHYNDIKKQ